MSGGPAGDGCLFCNAAAATRDTDGDNLVLHRAELNFVIINKYPYNNGHLMIAPFAHVADLDASSSDQLTEMMTLARSCERILRDAYDPQGFNIGLNLGAAAGAGVLDHLHLHIVPRWSGDASFLTATADTRVIPETPLGTYDRLRSAFEDLAPGDRAE